MAQIAGASVLVSDRAALDAGHFAHFFYFAFAKGGVQRSVLYSPFRKAGNDTFDGDVVKSCFQEFSCFDSLLVLESQSLSLIHI